MPFVKLDTGILDSTLWIERECREIFITALLMAEPVEYTSPVFTIRADSLEPDSFIIPPGWYGFVAAAGPGIVRRALVDQDTGMAGLRRLTMPDPGSRSNDFEGRRMARVDGGYIILNYMKYRERDYTAAERQRRWRQRQSSRRNTSDVTQQVTHEHNANASHNASRSRSRSRSRGTTSSHMHKGVPYVAEPKKPRPAPPPQKPEKPPTAEEITRATWSAYATAYGLRYAVAPVRNAKSNSLIHALVKALGAQEAPLVAGFYLTHNRALYINSRHALELLVRDATGLRTDWKSGKQITETEARNSDRQQAALSSPPAAKPVVLEWWQTDAGVSAKARELGIAGNGDTFAKLRARVYLAVGDGPWLAKVDDLVSSYMRDMAQAINQGSPRT